MPDIKKLNDNFRKYLIGGKILLTQGIDAKTYEEVTEIMLKVRHFNNFTKDNDPYNEHDFGSFDYKGEKLFFKIDYYDKNYQYLSEDPGNPDVTNRVLTVMLAEEY